jgi:hypothetical protein
MLTLCDKDKGMVWCRLRSILGRRSLCAGRDKVQASAPRLIHQQMDSQPYAPQDSAVSCYSNMSVASTLIGELLHCHHLIWKVSMAQFLTRHPVDGHMGVQDVAV